MNASALVPVSGPAAQGALVTGASFNISGGMGHTLLHPVKIGRIKTAKKAKKNFRMDHFLSSPQAGC